MNAFASNSREFHERFLVKKIIGFGSNGVVLAAYDLQLHKAVAIKIIYKEQAGRIESRPPGEIEVLRHLAAPSTRSCDYIMRTYSDWQDLNHYYLVTELFGSSWLESIPSSWETGTQALEPSMKSANTAALAKNEPIVLNTTYRGSAVTHTLPFFEGSSDLWAWSYASRVHVFLTEGHRLLPLIPIKRFAKQLALGLAHLHANSIYHGDVKCENVLVGHDDKTSLCNARLADFGHAKYVYEGISTYGTWAVSPPEFLEDSPYLETDLDGRRADVFALGMVLYSLLNATGQTIPGSGGKMSFAQLELNSSYPMDEITELDSDGWSLLRGMCMVDPAARMTIQQVLAHPWLSGVEA
ncbi:Testis-specific serine/threonine-protein kinase 6 [Entophlyctis luteolus]|nr:Testis-specific serine/threonine-protein kinase 6 [Entophlyctis luteolus]